MVSLLKYTSMKRGESNMNFELLKAIVRQIEEDVNLGDYTAIEELLNDIPIEKLKGFLTEEK